MEKQKEGFWMLNSERSKTYENLLLTVKQLSNHGIFLFTLLDNEEKNGVQIPLIAKSALKNGNYFLQFKCRTENSNKIITKEVGPVAKQMVEEFYIPMREYYIQKSQRKQLRNFLFRNFNKYIPLSLQGLVKNIKNLRSEKEMKIKAAQYEYAAKLRNEEKIIISDILQDAEKVSAVLSKRQKFNWVTEHHIYDVMLDIE